MVLNELRSEHYSVTDSPHIVEIMVGHHQDLILSPFHDQKYLSTSSFLKGFMESLKEMTGWKDEPWQRLLRNLDGGGEKSRIRR